MKNKIKWLAIITIVTLVLCSFTCGKNGSEEGSESNSRNFRNTGGSGDITFSLEKRNSSSFTITVDGANWNRTVTDYHFYQILTFDPLIYPWEHKRTNNKVFTFTFYDEPDEYTSVSIGGNIVGIGVLSTDGGLTNYRVHPTKNRITFP